MPAAAGSESEIKLWQQQQQDRSCFNHKLSSQLDQLALAWEYYECTAAKRHVKMYGNDFGFDDDDDDHDHDDDGGGEDIGDDPR